MTKKDIENQLDSEHSAFEKIEKEDECYTPPYGDERINYIERSYVTNYSPLTSNLKFVRRTKGRRAGKFTPLYINQKGKSTKSPLEAYLKNVNEKLANTIAPIKKIDIEELEHIRQHIRLKVMQKHRNMLGSLAKEKERNYKK